MTWDDRPEKQIREHYEIEKDLAARLRNASREERRSLYTAVYDEMFRRVPNHPQLTHKAAPEQTAAAVRRKAELLKRFVNERSVFLELGPGDCALSVKMCRTARQVWAVDVSDVITRGLEAPDNFRLALSDGSSIPLPEASVDVAYSDQLMEHLHPEDAREQLRNIHRALVSGGIYLCITPNRLGGPHDVSRRFDREPTCFHLKEYTFAELKVLFREAGFRRVRAYVGARGTMVRFPFVALALVEKVIGGLPFALRKPLARSLPLRVLLGIRMVGVK